MQYVGGESQSSQYEYSPAYKAECLDNKIILLVEDDESIGALLLEVLSQETPYQTLLVKDSLQAMRVIEHVKPCLFITDYRLPYMSGIELYDQLRAQHLLEGTPAILISAHLPPEEEVRKRHLVGMSKPFELDDLLNTVETLLDGSSQEAANWETNYRQAG